MISNYTIRPTFRRRQPYLKGVPSSPRPCALQTALTRAANRRPLVPSLAVTIAGPNLHLQGVQHRRAHFLQQRRILHRSSTRRHFVGQSVVKFGVKHEVACGVEEFVSKGVAIQRLILEQGHMQAVGDFVSPGQGEGGDDVSSLLPSSKRDIMTITVPADVYIEPLDGEAVGNPRQEDGFHMPVSAAKTRPPRLRERWAPWAPACRRVAHALPRPCSVPKATK